MHRSARTLLLLGALATAAAAPPTAPPTAEITAPPAIEDATTPALIGAAAAPPILVLPEGADPAPPPVVFAPAGSALGPPLEQGAVAAPIPHFRGAHALDRAARFHTVERANSLWGRDPMRGRELEERDRHRRIIEAHAADHIERVRLDHAHPLHLDHPIAHHITHRALNPNRPSHLFR